VIGMDVIKRACAKAMDSFGDVVVAFKATTSTGMLNISTWEDQAKYGELGIQFNQEVLTIVTGSLASGYERADLRFPLLVNGVKYTVFKPVFEDDGMTHKLYLQKVR